MRPDMPFSRISFFRWDMMDIGAVFFLVCGVFFGKKFFVEFLGKD